MPAASLGLEHRDRAQIFRIAELFTDGRGAVEIANTVNSEFGLTEQEGWHRQQIYPAVAQAAELKMIILRPPPDLVISRQLQAEFGLKSAPFVIKTPGRMESHLVAFSAAEVALANIRILLNRRVSPVGLGIGMGRACLDFCRHLAELIRTAPDRTRIKLTLHSITAGCPANCPYYSPTSMFTLFDRDNVVDAYGLFCQTMCRVGDYDKVKEQAGYKAAYAQRDRIRLVVSSMGSTEDPHDMFMQSLIEEKVDIEQWKRLVAGNVQYRPYSAQGPIHEAEDDFRCVTLFELDDFRSKRFECLLISRQCGLCDDGANRKRAAALHDLLAQPSLREVFDVLFVDELIADEVLKLANVQQPLGDRTHTTPVPVGKESGPAAPRKKMPDRRRRKNRPR